MEIQHEIDQSPFEAGSLPHQGDKTALGDPNGAFGVEQLETLSDLPVLLQPFLLSWAAPAAQLNVVALVLSLRTVR